MNTDVFCGLDLSLTSTGTVVLHNTCELTNQLIKTKGEDFPHSLARVEYIADTIIGIVNTWKPVLVVVEDYFSGRNPKVIIALCELGTMVRYKLLKNGTPWISVAPTQLKKFCYGSGGGGKELVLKGVYKKWGIDVSSNDIADASVLAYMAQALIRHLNHQPQELLKYEQEVIEKILKERKVVTA